MSREVRYLSRRFCMQNMKDATEKASHYVSETIAVAQRLREDPDRDTRRARNACKACYYIPHVDSGEDHTVQCACCETAYTERGAGAYTLCQHCASRHGLCRYCGGDLEMSTARSAWPGEESAEQA